MGHLKGNSYIWCNRVKQWVEERDNKVPTSKEVKTEVASAGNVQGVKYGVIVELKVRKLNKEDGCRIHLHDLRMTRAHKVG